MIGYSAPSSATLLIRGQKTFTGAANLGAVGDCPIFTTTGAVGIHGFWARCTSDLVDTVDGALFTIGVTGAPAVFGDFTGVFDLDTIDTGDGLGTDASAKDGWGEVLSSDTVVMDNITMTISGQAITGGVLEFYALYQPLSSDGALSLGTGMVAI